MLRLAFLAVPVLWIGLANLGPLGTMLRISLLDVYPVPPGQSAQWSVAAYTSFFATPAYQAAWARSLAFASATTLLCLVVCFPLAFLIAARTRRARRRILLLVLLAPFWTSEIIRIFGVMLLLGNRGAVNAALRGLGLISAPLGLLYSNGAVLLGLVLLAVPSMLLPVYAALERLPKDCLEAAANCGATRLQTWRYVVIPMAAQGIAGGCALVFLLSLGAYAVPELLGGPDSTVFADTIGGFFASAANRWPMGAGFSVILLASGGVVSLAIMALAFRQAHLR